MQSVSKQTLKIYWQHAMRYKGIFSLILLCVVVVTVTDIIQPLLFKDFFNFATGGPTPARVTGMINIIWAILGLGILNQALWRIAGYMMNFFEPRVMSDLLNTCYEYLLGHSYSFFNNNFVGSIVTKTRRYQNSFEKITDNIVWNLFRTVLLIGFSLVVFFHLRPLLGYFALVWALLYMGVAYWFTTWKLPYDIKASAQDTRTTAHLADTITNSINLKLFSTERTEIKAFRVITDKMFRLRKHTWDLGQRIEIFQSIAVVGLNVAVLLAALRYWQQGLLTLGDFALLQLYMTQIFSQLWDFGRQTRNIYEALGDANEMTLMLMQPHEVVNEPDAAKIKVVQGRIEFRGVDFHYHEETPILEDFDLLIAPGERVAFAGPSGGGKSTLIKLLFRFLDIQGGQILVDGQDISKVSQESLRKAISLVSQEPILFHRSLLDNIRYGKPDATEAEVVAAAKAAHAHEFISQFPEGYKTFVGERGVKLSGGERQRVAIARAILKNAPILVLDEATSSLDSESEAFIQDALNTLMRGKTTIVVAHRLSTIMKMDRIIIIEDGRITEQGKHAELVKAKEGTYQRLWEIQAGGFENA